MQIFKKSLLKRIKSTKTEGLSMSYTHLHLHTEYSLLDGANKLEVLAKRLKELGMTSVAMTDHGNMFGAIDFYTKMKKYGINPIIGMEAYLHNNENIGDKATPQRFHLCLYAKNEVGYKNLMYLSSQAFINGFYFYPRINKKILRERSEGLICSSACLAGEVDWNLNLTEKNLTRGAGGYEAAKAAALEYKDIFGEDFYLEIMRHGILEQENIDTQILQIAKECDIKIIATNDAHYATKDDADFQEIIMCLGMGTTMSQKRLRHSVKEFYVKSTEEMERLFADIPEAIANTQEIADKCKDFKIDLKDDKTNPPTPPSFKFTKEYAKKEGLDIDNDEEYFKYKTHKGLEERLANIPPEKHQIYKDRLEYEISIICSMKFPGYMLIVWDFIKYAKEQGIPVGPGRGSAAGSLVAFCLHITDIDPIKYNLLFERFLNPERVSMPDIDTDFCQRRRQEVIKYMVDKYGKYNVAQVITFNKMLAKGVIRDVARVLDMPYKEADEFAKLIPDELGITLKGYEKNGEFKKGAWELEPKIQALVESNPLAKKVWENSLKVEGFNRNAGRHAAAIVVDSEQELWNKIPLFTLLDSRNKKKKKKSKNASANEESSTESSNASNAESSAQNMLDSNATNMDFAKEQNVEQTSQESMQSTPQENERVIVTQYSMKYLEPVDLVKFDFLGLKNLTQIDDTLKLIKERYGTVIDFTQVDVNDAKVYDLIQSGDTLGVFQIESGMFQGLSRRLKPSNFEDIVAIIALGRPGPMESGMVDDFINRKHGISKVTYMFDELKPILEATYGTIVYQEQVMQIVQVIGGFSLGEADLIRRAMGKKDEQIMADNKDKFVKGAIKNGHDGAKASELWELIVKFAGYGFNKSHSAAYAMLTFQTAYLKTYYKHEFMAAQLTVESDKITKVAKYIQETRNMSLEVLPPHVNLSVEFFGVADVAESSELESSAINSNKAESNQKDSQQIESSPKSNQTDSSATQSSTKKIVFGLGAIKGVGKDVISDIIETRKIGGKFKNLQDFVQRVDFTRLNKRSLEPLIKSGSLDNLGFSRACMMKHIDTICEIGRNKQKLEETIGDSLFRGSKEELSEVIFDFRDIKEFDTKTMLEYEYESLGIYITGHPLDEYAKEIKSIKSVVGIDKIEELKVGSNVLLIVKVMSVAKKVGKKSGKVYGSLKVIDLHGELEITIFEQTLLKLDMMDLDKPVVLKGRIDEREEENEVRVFDILPFEEAKKQRVRIEYKAKNMDNYEHQDVIPAGIKEVGFGHGCPLGLVLNTRIQPKQLEKISSLAKSNAGARELHIIIKEEGRQYVFKSHFLVSDSIKDEVLAVEELDGLAWLDLA